MNNYHSTSSFHQVNSSFKNEKEKEREREKSVNYLQTVESKLLEKDKSQPKLKNKMKTPSKPKLE